MLSYLPRGFHRCNIKNFAEFGEFILRELGLRCYQKQKRRLRGSPNLAIESCCDPNFIFPYRFRNLVEGETFLSFGFEENGHDGWEIGVRRIVAWNNLCTKVSATEILGEKNPDNLSL